MNLRWLNVSLMLFASAASAQNNALPTTGNVGIGTTTPATKLQVIGVAAIGENTNGTAIIDAYNGDAYFGNNSATNGIAISPSGYVGMGTTSPQYRLDVAGTIAANGIAAVQTGSIALAADGTYQIAGSSAINGVYTIDWYGPYRAEHYQVAVVAHQYAAAAVTILNSSTYSTPSVLSNFRVVGDAAATNRYFVVDVANRNGGTGNMYVGATGPTAVLSLSATPAGSTVIPNSVVSLNSAQSGNVGIGTTSPGAKLEVAGNVKLTAGSGASMTFQDGSVQTVAWNGVLGGGDYAESVDVIGDRTEYEPGDVLVIDPADEGKFLKSAKPYATAVMGIYSTKPGVVGRRQMSDKSHMKEEVPMAMVGVVPTKVSTEGGPIRPGDLLVTSSTPGYAMKGSDRSQLAGAIIGKALGHLDAGKGVIEVAVAIQ